MVSPSNTNVFQLNSANIVAFLCHSLNYLGNELDTHNDAPQTLKNIYQVAYNCR